MGIMTIDGQAIEFTDEPNVLSVIEKPGLISLPCVIIGLIIYLWCLPIMHGRR